MEQASPSAHTPKIEFVPPQTCPGPRAQTWSEPEQEGFDANPKGQVALVVVLGEADSVHGSLPM